MNTSINLLPYATLIVGAWNFINGILHDIFVLVQKRKYDRDLLRLLMDGHILITCGIMQIIAYVGLKEHAAWSFYVSGTASLSMLVYCAMIFPFLKSIVTILLNLALLLLLTGAFFKV